MASSDHMKPSKRSSFAQLTAENTYLLNRQILDVACPPGYTYVDIMQRLDVLSFPPLFRCYKIAGDTPKTFFAASNACSLDDAELVSIHSLEEGQALGGKIHSKFER